MIDDLLNYSDSKGQHNLWKKRNVLSIRKRAFEYGEFSGTALAKRVVDLTSFLPKDTPLEYRVKAIMQGVNAYSKCIVCENNFARVYDSGTIVLERHIVNAFDGSR